MFAFMFFVTKSYGFVSRKLESLEYLEIPVGGKENRAVRNTHVCGRQRYCWFCLQVKGGSVCPSGLAQDVPQSEQNLVPRGLKRSVFGRLWPLRFMFWKESYCPVLFMPVACPVLVFTYSLGKFLYLTK